MIDELLGVFGGIREHHVMPGENLATISKHYYGCTTEALTIWRHNTDVVSDPNQVFPGTVLVIPHLPYRRHGG